MRSVPAQITMHIANTFLWIAGLLLQSFLLFAFFRRRVAKRLPVITALIAFYLVRSALLFLISGHIAADDYGTLYNALSQADFLLQMVVVGELAWSVWRDEKGHGRAWIKIVIGIIVAVAISAGAASHVRVPGRYPPDRGMTFVAILMIFLVLWMIVAKMTGSPRRVAEGFAVYGAIGTLAGTERAYAAIHRNVNAFHAWSYVSTATWLMVVLFWIFALKTDEAITAASKSAGSAARGARGA
jgi:hypothetical protein